MVSVYGQVPRRLCKNSHYMQTRFIRTSRLSSDTAKKRIEFLDTWVNLQKGHVYTDLYLERSSCHPSHTKTGLAYGLVLRIRRGCEKDDDYYRHRKELKGQLRKRGYAGRFVESQLQRVDSLKRETLLEPKPKSAKQSTSGDDIFKAPTRCQKYPAEAFQRFCTDRTR